MRPTTMDVLSLRARIDDDTLDYHFRMVDEYQNELHYQNGLYPHLPSWPSPLSLSEVNRMLETWDATGLAPWYAARAAARRAMRQAEDPDRQPRWAA